MGKLFRLVTGAVLLIVCLIFGPQSAWPQIDPMQFDAAEIDQAVTYLLRDDQYSDAQLTEIAAMAVGLSTHLLGASPSSARSSNAKRLLERALSIREKLFGENHLLTSEVLVSLATARAFLGEFNSLSALIDRIVRIEEAVSGKTDPRTLTVKEAMGSLLHINGEMKKAEIILREVLATKQEALGEDHLESVKTQRLIAQIKREIGNHSIAESMFMFVLDVRKKRLGETHVDVAESLVDVGQLYLAEERFVDAERIFREALRIYETNLGREHYLTVRLLSDLASALSGQGRDLHAQQLFDRAAVISNRVLGPGHPVSLAVLGALANFHLDRGRYAESESVLRRALDVARDKLGADHIIAANYMGTLANVLRMQGRVSESEVMLKAVVEANEKAHGSGHADTLLNMSRLALVYDRLGKSEESRLLNERVLAARENLFGVDHPQVAISLHNLAVDYERLGNFDKAKPLHIRAAAIREKWFGYRHPYTAASYRYIGWNSSEQKDWSRALEFYQKATSINLDRLKNALDTVVRDQDADDVVLVDNMSGIFEQIRSIFYLSQSAGSRVDRAREMTFELAQQALQSDASTALTRVASRLGATDGHLAEAVREKQNLSMEWIRLERALTNSIGRVSRDGNGEFGNEIRARLAEVEGRVGEINYKISNEFPHYGELSLASSTTVEGVQALLRKDEVLLQYFVGAKETFVWVVTPERLIWRRISFEANLFDFAIRAIRCGLSETEWSQVSDAQRCQRMLALPDVWKSGQPLPFNLGTSFLLYHHLLGPFHKLIEGKRLIVVPSGALTSLPFHLLVTAKPSVNFAKTPQDYLAVSWLGMSNAISVLPSVHSFKVLRTEVRGSGARNEFFGVGAPVLEGNKPAWAKIAKKAWHEMSSFFRGNLADVDAVRSLEPLPDTKDELDGIARRVGALRSKLLLGDAATEREIKRLSKEGTLKKFRVLHFATHGLLAGEIKGLAEPALVLTPPREATYDDDGLLTASEIALLDLDADWVVLSACQTAGTKNLGNRGLAGLVQAFFFAGARSMLASHWPVYSSAAVSITTRMFAELEEDSNIGRAEALRRAMRSVMRSGGTNAHPAYWAPFSIIGEGG